MSPNREREALDWARRVDDPDFADWDAHVAWLEADPANAAAFDRMLLVIDEAAMSLADEQAAVPANDNPLTDDGSSPVYRRSGLRWGLGIAAAIAAMVGVVTLMRQSSSGEEVIAYATAPGQHRAFRLSDGTTVAMNGDSAIAISSGSGRRLRIERGEVFLNVVHDPARPLEVLAGDIVMRDVGTRFNVRHDSPQLALAVQEGAVEYDPGGAAIQLQAGQELRHDGHRVVVRRLDPGAIGTWRAGRLVYRDAPLMTVATDLSRAIGEPVIIEPSANAIRFTGVLAIERDHARVLHRLGAAADVQVRRVGPGWRVAANRR